jgi:ABC-type transport system involved in multi-copper enzyme maturation permease subunit
MLARVVVIMLNTYREAVRARILHGLFALALATAVYSAIVGEFATRSAMRVLSNLGAASISIYGIVVAVVMGATSLYRELELKTIFPILTRPIRRGEYLIGKYLGTVLTLGVFITANVAVLLMTLGFMSGRSPLPIAIVAFLSVIAASLVAWRVARWRTYVPLGWAAAVVLYAWYAAGDTPIDRRVVVLSAVLTLFEVGIVTAIATVFSAFSSPFLTAVFTFGVFIVGRSADTLAHLPPRVFGELIHSIGERLSAVVPNLMLYVPPRPLLTGETIDINAAQYLLRSGVHAVAWSAALLSVAILVFRRRDFV